MINQSQNNLNEKIIDLFSHAELNIGFINGEGLGAFLLTIIAIFFIMKPHSTHRSISTLLKILQRKS